MIFLVRHGQTAFNAEGRVQGGLDSPLTELGVDQGRRIGRTLGALAPSDIRIIASPLGRAQHTARLIREAGGFTAQIETDHRLAEVELGVWDGKLRADIAHAAPEFDQGRHRWDWFFHAPGGVSYEVFSDRLSSWLREASAFTDPVIVISHGVAGRVLRGLFLGLPREEALMQDVPQDAFFHLQDGQIVRIECP